MYLLTFWSWATVAHEAFELFSIRRWWMAWCHILTFAHCCMCVCVCIYVSASIESTTTASGAASLWIFFSVRFKFNVTIEFHSDFCFGCRNHIALTSLMGQKPFDFENVNFIVQWPEKWSIYQWQNNWGKTHKISKAQQKTTQAYSSFVNWLVHFLPELLIHISDLHSCWPYCVDSTMLYFLCFLLFQWHVHHHQPP